MLWQKPILFSPDDEGRLIDLRELDLVEVLGVDRSRENEKMIESLAADVRREISGDELVGHVQRIGNALRQQIAHQRRGSQYPARDPERITTRAFLEILDLVCGDVLVRD